MFNKDIEQLLTFIRCICNIDFRMYDKTGKSDLDDVFSKSFIANHLDFANRHIEGPIIAGNESGLQFIIVSDKLYNHYVLGPFSLTQFVDKEIENLLDNTFTNNLSITERRHLRSYLSDIPVLEQNTIFQYCIMLFYAVNKQKLPFSSIIIEKNNYGEQSNIKDDTLFITSYQLEKQTYDSIKNGQKANFDMLFNYADIIRYRKVYPKNMLRSRKDLSLFFIGLSAHAAIEAGLDINTVYNKQAYYTTLIEETNNTAKLSEIEMKLFEDYSNATYNLLGKKDKDSMFIKKVEVYVNANIYDPITFEDIASSLNLSKYYLSKRFYNETGIRLQDYINIQKMEIAKELLKYTNYSITKISEQLSYNNMAHFCQTFKKITGTTCNQYRNSNITNNSVI